MGGRFKKGEKRPPGAGRKRGSLNKQTKDIKELIGKLLQAIDKIGVEKIVDEVKVEDKGYSSLMKALVRLAPQNLHVEGDVNISQLSREDLEKLREND